MSLKILIITAMMRKTARPRRLKRVGEIGVGVGRGGGRGGDAPGEINAGGEREKRRIPGEGGGGRRGRCSGTVWRIPPVDLMDHIID